MSNNINHNNLIPISIPHRHTNNNIKLAKSIFSTPTPIIKQIIPSISSNHHKISALSQKTLQKHTSNITPTIINTSVTKKPKQQYITKIKTHEEKLKTKILISSRSRTAYSTDPTTEEHNSKTFTFNTSIQQPIIPVTNGTPPPELFIPTRSNYRRYPRPKNISPYQSYSK